MSKFTVALVGRPNVGKSTLFNKLIGERLSIVDDMPGVTRDRVYGDCEWRGKKISLIDTGGIERVNYDDKIGKGTQEQAEFAIEIADVIVFVVDDKTGLIAADNDVASMLQKSGKPIIICANKADKIGIENFNFLEFYNLGLGEPIAVSSIHGHGTGDLLDAIYDKLPEIYEENEEDFINVAVIGRPNAGKSSLINYIVGEERCIVSDVAGTTRDTIDTKIENEFGNYNFIDTAGIRRKSKVNDNIEKYSIIRANLAIERSDICVVVIDAVEGATDQDVKITNLAHDAGKACIIFINKWDLIEKDEKTLQEYKKKLQERFVFAPYAIFMFASAKTGSKVKNLFENINIAFKSSNLRISTGILNEMLAQFINRVPPPTQKGRRLKIYYMTQVSTKPPTFVFFVNRADIFHFSYQHYLEKNLRNAFGFEGTPIRFVIREKGEQTHFSPQK